VGRSEETQMSPISGWCLLLIDHVVSVQHYVGPNLLPLLS
jgi:hypothetical protein